MAGLVGIVYVVVAAIVGERVCDRLRVPAASMIGPLIAVGGLALTGLDLPRFPSFTQFFIQVVVGAGIGQQVTRGTVRNLRGLVIPAVLVLGWTLGATFGLAKLVTALTTADPLTSVLSACPGGMTEMTILAVSVGADAAVVLVFQMFRFFSVLIVVPFAVSTLSAKGPAPVAAGVDSVGTPRPGRVARVGATAVCLAIGLVGGYLASWLRWPTPGLIGALVAVGAAQVAGLDLEPPLVELRTACNVGLGALLGTTVTREVLAGVASVLVPAGILTLALVVSGTLLGLVVRRLTGWDLQTSLLCAAPAGITQMVVVAGSLGCDQVRVSLLHLVRILTVVAVVPTMLAHWV